MAYMFSYYGIAAAAMGSVLNYLLLGLASQIDKFYLHSFEIFLACTVVFPGLGNAGFTLFEYRIGHRTLLGALVENLRWVPFLYVLGSVPFVLAHIYSFFFFGGLSIHLSTAILAHLCSYDMTWGSTGKEVEKSTFWIEVPRIFRRFWLSLLICTLLVIMMIIFNSNLVPFTWQIQLWNWALILPLAMVAGCHIMLPVRLPSHICLYSRRYRLHSTPGS